MNKLAFYILILSGIVQSSHAMDPVMPNPVEPATPDNTRTTQADTLFNLCLKHFIKNRHTITETQKNKLPQNLSESFNLLKTTLQDYHDDATQGMSKEDTNDLNQLARIKNTLEHRYEIARQIWLVTNSPSSFEDCLGDFFVNARNCKETIKQFAYKEKFSTTLKKLRDDLSYLDNQLTDNFRSFHNAEIGTPEYFNNQILCNTFLATFGYITQELSKYVMKLERIIQFTPEQLNNFNVIEQQWIDQLPIKLRKQLLRQAIKERNCTLIEKILKTGIKINESLFELVEDKTNITGLSAALEYTWLITKDAQSKNTDRFIMFSLLLNKLDQEERIDAAKKLYILTFGNYDSSLLDFLLQNFPAAFPQDVAHYYLEQALPEIIESIPQTLQAEHEKINNFSTMVRNHLEKIVKDAHE